MARPHRSVAYDLSRYIIEEIKKRSPIRKKEHYKNKDSEWLKGNPIQASQNLFLNNLFKIGYSKKTPKNIRKIQYLSFVIKAFQRRYRQELVNGKMDKECLIISKNLLNR